MRAALVKTAPSSGKTAKERELAIAQIVSRAEVSTEIVDILQAAGMQSPDISILSDEFLTEVQGMEKKNLATEEESNQTGGVTEPKVTFWSR